MKKILMAFALIGIGCAPVKRLSVLEYLVTQESSTLFPYIKCKCGDDLRIVEVNKKGSNAPKFRLVPKDSESADTISVIEGYRVMYAYENTQYYFANVKVEKSNTNQFESDKSKLINSSRHISIADTSTKVIFQDTAKINGYRVISHEKQKIDIGGIIGSYTIFSNEDDVIVTIYLLNQEKQNRRFNSFDDYIGLRDVFLFKFTDCMQKKNRDIPIAL